MKFAWIADSRKAQVALGSVLTILMSRLLPHVGFSPDDTNAMTLAIITLGSVWIGGIAHEDAATKSAPQNQVNVGSKVTNTPATASTEQIAAALKEPEKP